MLLRPIVALCLALLCSLAVLAQDSPYVASLERWRADHEAALRADDGWLTVVGLAWLKDGANRAGSAADADVRLPAGTPGALGVFHLSSAAVRFDPAPGVPARINGQPAGARAMRPDADTISTGSLSLFIIRRGDKFGVRMKDRDSAARRAFAGEQWYPGREAWRVTARFEPYAPPKMIPILNVLGQTDPQPSPGAVVFTIAGKEYRLDPIGQGRELFFIFKDLTSADTTYPAGRFLYTALPQNGQVVLDFNKAENPPCAFTEFATCPLPPRQNQLPIRIEAGEQYTGRR
jgi:uncharacterized protein